SECNASLMPTTVSCRPRGWKRAAYNCAGSKPLGNCPADFTGKSRSDGIFTSRLSTRVTCTWVLEYSATCQVAGTGCGNCFLLTRKWDWSPTADTVRFCCQGVLST